MIIMANIKEVARRAGVSAATVSKYLNGTHVKKRNAEAIDAAVSELGFKRNDIARGLRTNKSMTVGVLLPELDNIFFTQIISAVDSVLELHGYGTVVAGCHSDGGKEEKKLDFLRSKQIDGLIAIPCTSASEFVRKLDLPVVLIDRAPDCGNCDCILSDNEDASYKAAVKLINAGHTKIGVLLGPFEMFTPVERRDGFLHAVDDMKISYENKYMLSGKYTVDDGYCMMCSLLDMPDPPTAIYATNNELTIGAVTALNERNLTPGVDISFIGFDNLTLALSAHPRLDVITQQVNQIGITAANVLLSQMKGGDVTGIIRLPTLFREYSSVIDISH